MCVGNSDVLQYASTTSEGGKEGSVFCQLLVGFAVCATQGDGMGLCSVDVRGAGLALRLLQGERRYGHESNGSSSGLHAKSQEIVDLTKSA